MNRVVAIAILILLVVGTTACKSNSGSREFIPGKGWVPTR